MPQLSARLCLLVLLVLLGLPLAGGPAAAAPDPLAALAAGNEAAAAGKTEEAARAYLEGYDPAAVHPTLAYNLGSTLHQLGRLPEAILWYRRAAGESAGAPGGDPWLEDNLLLARRTLGSQTAGHPDFWAELRKNAPLLNGAAIAVAWAGAALALFLPRRRGLAAIGLAAGLGLFAVAWLSYSRGAREAVLLSDCATGAGNLPAGSELWVVPEGAAYRIAGSRDASCPAASLALIRPD